MKASVSKMIKATFLLAAALTALPAMAQVITFTISATGSGTLGDTAFSDATITFTQVTNTAAIINPCFGYSYPCAPDVATNTVTIGGVGTETLTGPTYFFDNGINVAGIANAPFVVFLGLEDSSLASYNMQSSFGPTSFGTYSGSSVSGESTSGGTLDITWANGDATFTAALGSPTPEPATFGLMLTGAGLLGLMMAMRRR